MNIVFDPAKNKTNIRRHDIDFAEVEQVFYDEAAITFEDRDHGEQRFVTLGMDGIGRLLVVCYAYQDETTIRVISARKAEPHEARNYKR